MHPWLGVRPPAHHTANLARPCGLATCPYFSPDHEQEAPEGEEEQVEPEGHERDQHRLKLLIKALGEGQDEQELWKD